MNMFEMKRMQKDRGYSKNSGNSRINIHMIKTKLLVLVELLVVWGLFTSLAIAHLPHDDVDLMEISPTYYKDKMVIISVRNNLLKSTDGGERWHRMINGLDYRSTPSSIAIPDSYGESKEVFASTEKSGIYRSIDGGQTWTQLTQPLDAYTISKIVTPQHFKDDPMLLVTMLEGGCFTVKSDGSDGSALKEVNGSKDKKITSVSQVSISADRKMILGDKEGDLFFYNGTLNQLEPITQIPGVGAITAIGHAPDWQEGEFIVVGSEKGGLLKGTLGEPLEKISEVPSGKPIMSIAFSPDYLNDRTIVVSTWDEAVFISKDGGDHWTKHDHGLTKEIQADEGKLPHFRDIQISSNFAMDKTIFLNGFDGVFKSIDGGLSWRALETFPAGTIVSLDVSPGYRDAQKVVFSTYAGGAFCLDSTYGDAWEILNYGMGFGAIRRTAIHFSPNYGQDNTIFTTTNDALLVSNNSGKSWEKYNIRNIKWCPSIIEKWFKIGRYSKTEFGRPWVPTSLILSPNYSTDNTIFLGLRKHGAIRSTDGGKSFHTIWQNGKHEPDSIVVSPDFANDGTVFLSSPVGSGVYRSIDRGETWSETGKGITFDQNTVLLSISPNFKEDQTLFAATTHGVFKTTDRAETWQLLNWFSNQKEYVEAIVVSPNFAKDKELIISIRGKGLFKTNDGGETFRSIGTRFLSENNSGTLYYGFPERSTPIKYSPFYAEDNTIYLTSGAELFISTDRGEKWTAISRPVRYEDIRKDVILYTDHKDWHKRWNPAGFNAEKISAEFITETNKKGATVNYRFFGSGVSWIGTQNSDQGMAKVYIDGKFHSTVDQFGPVAKEGVRTFTIKNLPAGSHDLKIEVCGEKNEKSNGHRIVVDAFDVFP